MQNQPAAGEFGPNRGPLSGIRVLDLTQALSGPFATYLLAGLGAEVIKIENPKGGDFARHMPPFFGHGELAKVQRDDEDLSFGFMNRCRGKLGMALNLKSSEGVEVFLELVKTSHVVVENYASGTANGLGIGYDVVRRVNPAIVYCSISGYGADQEIGRGSMDSIAQALSGVMLSGGHPEDMPYRVGIPIADTAAPLFGVMGVCAALVRAQATGEGDHVDVSMLGSLTTLVASENWQASDRLGQEPRTGPRLTRLSPFGTYSCKDGYVSLAAPNDRQAHALMRAIGRPELIDTREFATVATRAINDDALAAIIEEWAADYTAAEVVDILDAAGVPAAPVRSPLEALEDPRLHERGELTRAVTPQGTVLEDLATYGMPIKLKNARGSVGRPAPLLGQHTDHVLGDIYGFDSDHVEGLRARGVIA